MAELRRTTVELRANKGRSALRKVHSDDMGKMHVTSWRLVNSGWSNDPIEGKLQDCRTRWNRQLTQLFKDRFGKGYSGGKSTKLPSEKIRF